jgi:methyl-accepting chemotaxis protein
MPTSSTFGLGPWTIRRRLAIGFGITILLLVVATALGLGMLRQTQLEMQTQIRGALDVRQNLATSDGATRDFVILAENDLLGGDPAYRARMDSLFSLADSTRWVLTTGSALSDEERGRIEHIGVLQSRIGVRLALARAASDVGQREETVRQSRLSEALLDSLFDDSRTLAAARLAETDRQLADLHTAAKGRQVLMAALAAVGVLLAFLFGIATWRAVVRPLAALTATARRMGEGDFRVEDVAVELDAEYRALANAFVDTMQRLSSLVRAIQAQAGEVAESAGLLTNSSSEAATATEQISATIESIATAAAEQIHQLTAARAVLERVGDSADQLNDTATASTELGVTIHRTAARAHDDIGEALETLRRARDVIASSTTNVSRLTAAAASISVFVSAIQDVADMTNLLALNAAIEAARAGDHGRGFAVVAEEVRQLSAKSAQSALEVQNVVDAMQRDVGAATDAFASGSAALGDVDNISRTATAAVERIQSAVAGMSDVATSLSSAAVANRAAVEELVRQVEATADGASGQAAASEEAAAGAQQSAASTAAMASTAERLLQNAAKLNELVAEFTV